MLLLYRMLFVPALLLVLPHYLYRMWRRGGYKQGFRNRLGILSNVPPKAPGVKRIWIQAVSVGELNAIGALLDLFGKDPRTEVVLTTTTSTGYSLMSGKYRELAVWRGMFPVDFWPFSTAAWRALEPDLAVLMEGELWPEHIHQASRRGVPVCLINARISDRSFLRHFRMRHFTRRLYRKLDSIHAGSKTNAKRFKALAWIPSAKIRTTGNLKLDISLQVDSGPETRRRFRETFGFADEPDPLILLGASTWPGEEKALLSAYRELRREFPNLRLLIVPRHAERRTEIERVVRDTGLAWHLRSSGRRARPGTLVHIADTTGELATLTTHADVVFIGKSLPPNDGGQTPIEAAALGKPMIMGPAMSNFRDVSRRLIKLGAAHPVDSGDDLSAVIRRLLRDDSLRLQSGKAGSQLVAESVGASIRTFDALMKICRSDSPRES